MESTHLLSGSKKRVKIHPHTVTPGVHTHFPQPGDDGYDDAPSFEDFGSFLEETSDRKQLTESKKCRTAKGAAKGVGEQLASFSEASVSASRLMWVGLLGAALAHGCLILLTRVASERFGLGPLFLVVVRSVVQLVSVAVPLHRGENPFGPEGYRLRLICYGIAYSLALCSAYSSLTFVSSGNATTTWRLATTAFSATLAFLLLEERLGLGDGITLAAGLCGLGLVLLPTTDESNTDLPTDPVVFWRGAFGWSLSALAGLWMALALVGYRSLKERVGVGTALFTAHCHTFIIQLLDGARETRAQRCRDVGHIDEGQRTEKRGNGNANKSILLSVWRDCFVLTTAFQKVFLCSYFFHGTYSQI
uniref:EamA domain-containing protein n=1 Tax=Gouania willdenowi TaxID=441366 RepID=A0A8C5H364_GOUWI